MSFGWSAGDVVNAMLLVKKVYGAFSHIPEAKKEFNENMQFLLAFELNLNLIHTYLTKSSPNRSGSSVEAIKHILEAVKVEFKKFKTFLESKRALREHIETKSMRTKTQRMAQALHWGIGDLNEKVQELRQGLTQVLSVLGLYLTYELNNEVSAVSEVVQNVGGLIKENQESLTISLDRVDDNFSRAIESLKGAQVGWELLMRDTIHGWITEMKDQSNTKSTQVDRQTKTIDSIKVHVEVQTEALQHMRSEVQETMSQVGSVMQIVLKRIDDDIQIDNAEDSTIVQKSRKVHKQRRTLEKLLLASTQAGNIVNKGTEQATHSISPIHMAMLVKQLDTRLKQIGLSSVMTRFLNDGKNFGKGIGRGSVQAIRALQQAWASIGLTVQISLTKQQLPLAQPPFDDPQVEDSSSRPGEGDPERPEPTQLVRSNKAPPPPPPVWINQSPVTETETHSHPLAGPSRFPDAVPTPPRTPHRQPTIPSPSAPSPSLSLTKLQSPSPRTPPPPPPPPPRSTTPPPEPAPVPATTQHSASSPSPQLSRTQPQPIPKRKPAHLSSTPVVVQ